MSTDQRDALEEAGVVQRHVVTKYRDGHVNVEDVTATHPADALGAVRMNQPPTGEAVAWMTPGGDVSRSWLWCNERCLAGQNPTPLYTAPPADAPGAVRALVAKWRDAAEGSTDSPNPTIKAVARCHNELATELEAALAQAPASGEAVAPFGYCADFETGLYECSLKKSPWSVWKCRRILILKNLKIQ